MDEMDVQPVDLGDVLVEAVQRRLTCAPVVFVGPVRRQLPGVGQRDALAPVVDALLLGPSCAREPVSQIGQGVVGYRDPKGPHFTHGAVLLVS